MQTFFEWMKNENLESLDESIGWDVLKAFLKIVSSTINAADMAIGYAEKALMATAAGAAMYGWNFLRSKMNLPPDPISYLGYGAIAAVYTFKGIEEIRSYLQDAIEGLESVIAKGNKEEIKEQKSKIEELKNKLVFAFSKTKRQFEKIKPIRKASYMPSPFQ